MRLLFIARAPLEILDDIIELGSSQHLLRMRHLQIGFPLYLNSTSMQIRRTCLFHGVFSKKSYL